VPDRTVTLLYGDGGTGKSLLALQLAAATALGVKWIGLQPAHGPVLYLSAEDDLDELHRRLGRVDKGCEGPAYLLTPFTAAATPRCSKDQSKPTTRAR
jgi:RecA-family ATPase